MHMKILVTGANGQLGRCLFDVSSETDNEFVFCDRERLDITNIVSIINILNTEKPDCIINCAAYTNTSAAENDANMANNVNILGPAYIAMECSDRKIQFIHISTDYVFDGKTNVPYSESDKCNPINVYGRTKFIGEKEVMNIDRKAIIIRTSWLYSEYGSNFVSKTIDKLKNGERLKYVYDEIGSPTYCKNLARFILKTVLGDDKTIFENGGIWHYCDCGVASRYDFAKAIEDFYIGDNSDLIEPISMREFETKTKRPAYSVLSTKLPDYVKRQYWRDALCDCISAIREKRVEHS